MAELIDTSTSGIGICRGVERVQAPLAHAAARVGTAAAAPVVRQVFSNLEAECIDEEHMPRWLIYVTKQALRDQLNYSLQMVHDGLEASLSRRKQRLQEYLQSFRATGNLGFCVHPYSAVRAFLLYRLAPADETAWFKTSTLAFWCCVAVFLVQWAGVNDWAFLFLYVLTSRTDEYQLCHVIVWYKIQQFLFSGVVPLTTFMWSVFYCLRDGVALSDEALDFDARLAPCTGMYTAPSTAADYANWLAELLRVLCVWHAFWQLRRHAHGGEAQWRALEFVRLDLADGELDGKLDRRKARAVMEHHTHHAAQIPTSARGSGHGSPGFSLFGATAANRMQTHRGEALRVCREKYVAFAAEQRRREGDAHRRPDGGPLMGALLWWDVLTFASMALATALLVGTSSFALRDWFVWYALEITKLAQALCGFPFLLVGLLPLEAVTGAYPTGHTTESRTRNLLIPRALPADQDTTSSHLAEGTTGTAGCASSSRCRRFASSARSWPRLRSARARGAGLRRNPPHRGGRTVRAPGSCPRGREAGSRGPARSPRGEPRRCSDACRTD
jgi:hypothetical protein